MHFDVDHGEILGLLGPNGAGKTTTMNVMTADYTSSAGEVCVLSVRLPYLPSTE